ncbi:hypothetical protein [Streptomyces parvulus]|uniref:Phosphatidate cytidylyltransferase n=1 Tax=Streptomyces parvulus TaxID=146923 RepID=A0ABV5DH31_9ACTN
MTFPRPGGEGGTGPGGDRGTGQGGDRGMKRLFHALLLAAALVFTAGLLADLLWLLGIGTWTLIAALLVELVHRP